MCHPTDGLSDAHMCACHYRHGIRKHNNNISRSQPAAGPGLHGTNYYENPWAERVTRTVDSHHNESVVFTYVLLHFSKRRWKWWMENGFGPPVAYPYAETESKIIMETMMKRFKDDALHLLRK